MSKDNHVAEISKLLTEDYQKVFGDQVISVILYGSAVTDEYLDKKSDLNFLIALSEEGIDQLHLVYDLVEKWRKKNVSTPLFLTKSYVESSQDTFPIEFLNIKQSYKLIFGEDILAALSFEKHFVRIQCERELKGKLLLLRERYVETRGKPAALRILISNTLPDFIFIFKGILFLIDKTIPATKQETINILVKEFDLDRNLFLSLFGIREGKLKLSAKELEALFQMYLKEIRKLTVRIDALDVKMGVGPSQVV
jgi:predicted nucleotidyltransferase